MKRKFLFITSALILTFNLNAEESQVCYPAKKITHPKAPPVKNVHPKNDGGISPVFYHSEWTPQTTQVVVQYGGDHCQDKSKPEGNEADPWMLKSIFDLITKVIASISWPLAIIFVMSKFKKELAQLISRIKRLSVAGNEIEMVDVNELLGGYNDNNDSKLTVEQEVKVTLDPVSSLISSWLDVEMAIRSAYERANIPTVSHLGTMRNAEEKEDATTRPKRSLPIRQMAERLYRERVIKHKSLSLIMDLNKIRNSVVHIKGYDFDEDAASKYISLANKLVSELGDLGV